MRVRNRGVARFAVLLLAGLVTLFACFGVWLYTRPLPSAATPAGTVLRYYTLIGLGRADAHALMAPEYGAQPLIVRLMPLGFAPDNRFALYDLGIAGSNRIPEDDLADRGLNVSEYRDLHNVYVHFIQRWGDGVTSDAGGQYRVVTVGRKNAGLPWRILSFGTGG